MKRKNAARSRQYDPLTAGPFPCDLYHPRGAIDPDDVVAAASQCQGVDTGATAQIGKRSRRRNDVGHLVGGSLDQLTMLRLIVSPFERSAFSVVHEAEEPPRRWHSRDASRLPSPGALDMSAERYSTGVSRRAGRSEITF